MLKYLNKNNIEYIKTAFLKNTLDAVSTHPDMQICKLDKKTFVCEPTLYDYYTESFKDYEIEIIKGKTKISSTYPRDISYNVVITDNFMMHNTRYTDENINRYIVSTGVSIYNVKQGYTKCASCVIDNNAIITSDVGIHRVCLQNDIDSLLVEKDIIKLGERNDGFLGGCCGMIDYKKLLFCGNISVHKSYPEILKFASKYDVSIISSSDEMLTDIGSLISVI